MQYICGTSTAAIYFHATKPLSGHDITQRQQAEQRAENLAARLRELGIDPDQLN